MVSCASVVEDCIEEVLVGGRRFFGGSDPEWVVLFLDASMLASHCDDNRQRLH